MKISIYNFKSIDSVVNYELKPLTILSGNNSSGKSSFIQLLLLLKQTLDIDSSKYPLRIEGEFYSVKDYIDIIRGKNKSNKLQIAFEIDKSEFDKYDSGIIKSIFDNFPAYKCHVNILYDFDGDDLYIKEFSLSYTFPEKTNSISLIQDKKENKGIKIKTDNEYFTKVNNDSNTVYTQINYSSIFPSSYEFIQTEEIDNPKGDVPLINETKGKEYPNIDSVKSFIVKYFNELFYIGPLRTAPQDSYPNTKNFISVGTQGENVAQVLERRKDEPLSIYLPYFENEGIRFELKTTSLIEATNHWICTVFKFGKKLHAKESGENYSIILTNFNNLETTIKHVGFGISQILPIIVQGLLLSNYGTLILEQPEIHLHPKIQSLLFDFLHSLILSERNVIIETHSDHFITRMRRRIAEDKHVDLKKKINLTFIESSDNGLLFHTLNMDEYGSLTFFPDEFIERPDIELKALINAQMKKRLAKK